MLSAADARRDAAADRRRGKHVAQQTFRCEVPRLYHGATFAGFVCTTPKRITAATYLHHTPLQALASAILLGGAAGRGKTHLAAALARRYAIRGHSICWANDAHAAEAWRAAHADQDADPAAIIDQMITATLLVIDDLGKCRPSDKWAAEIYHIIDHRLANASPMLITTNCSGAMVREHFGQNYGPALESRLRECRIFPIDGDDMRVARWAE